MIASVFALLVSISPGWLTGLSMPSALAQSESGAVIQVRSVVEVDGSKSDITLGDLVVARDLSEATLALVSQVRVADMPKAGESRTFTAAVFEQIVRPQLREIEDKTGERISLRVPTRVTVARSAFQMRPKDVEASLRSQLKALCGDCEFEITGLNLPLIPATTANGSSWQIRMRPEIPKGNFSVPVEVTSAEGARRNYWISGTLSVRREVPVAARALQFGEKIQSQDFNMQMRDVTFSADVGASSADFDSSVVARQIGAGQIIWRNSLRRELAMKSGDVVKVTAGGESWQITIDGVAQSNGYIGDVVRVKIPRTQKLVSGVLREKGVVEVQ
jgi:flagella basal body P-ring formation protein FlgA